MATKNNPAYRPDIDGLRALAVIPVVLYHFGVQWMPGGFVGVDIFFVISGFLITSILRREIEAGTFSLSAFWVRRVRRIMPAMLMTLVATLIAGYAISWPSDLTRTAEGAAYSTFGLANIYFYLHTGYFDPFAYMQPLLHFWSLAVEEQFYVVWPIALYCGMRWAPRQWMAPAIVVLIVASVAGAVYQIGENQSAAFYLPHLRAWELMAGALVGYLPALAPALRQAVAITGVGLVAYAVFWLTQFDTFPGMNALPPVIGAALLIWSGAGGRTLVSEALKWRPARFVGLISYSMYLWHWPLIAYYRQATNIYRPELLPLCMLLVATLALAALSWRFIERPFRTPHLRTAGHTRTFSIAAAAMLTVAACAMVVVGTSGFQFRLDPALVKVTAYSSYFPGDAFRDGRCFLEQRNKPTDFDLSECLPSRASVKTAILWGDSTIAQYFHGLRDPLQRTGFSVGQLTSSLCAPIEGYAIPQRPRCKAMNDFALSQILQFRPTVVILGALWPLDDHTVSQFKQTVAKLRDAGIQAVMIGDVPRFNGYVWKTLAERIEAGKTGDDLRLSEVQNGAALRASVAAEQKIATEIGIGFVSTIAALCPSDKCQIMTPDGTPMYWDYLHMTAHGSEIAGTILAPLITAQLTDRGAPAMDAGVPKLPTLAGP